MPEHTRTTTPFDAASTANRVLEGVDLTGRRAVVTGASSGIGVETARALAGAGAEVTLAVRNPAAGKSTAADITATTGNSRLHVAALDLTDQSSVAEFTSAWQGPLHILVNNAGVMAAHETRTSEGWELQFATNHYGHFKLTTELHGALASEGARVVAVSSSAHLLSGVVFDDIHFRQREYAPWSAYGQSKSANVLFAVAASKRWAQEGITANALMPGAIPAPHRRRRGGAVAPGNPRSARAHVEDAAAGRCHLRSARRITPRGRRHGTLLRGLQRGRTPPGKRAARRLGPRARPGRGRAALEALHRRYPLITHWPATLAGQSHRNIAVPEIAVSNIAFSTGNNPNTGTGMSTGMPSAPRPPARESFLVSVPRDSIPAAGSPASGGSALACRLARQPGPPPAVRTRPRRAAAGTPRG